MSISRKLKRFNKQLLDMHNELKKQGVDVFSLDEEALLNRIADCMMQSDKNPAWMVELSLYCFASRFNEFSPGQLIDVHMQRAVEIDLPEEETLH